MDNKAIANEINYDIESGMYEGFDKLKNKLEHIAHRLVLALYVDNIELSDIEIQALEDTEYL